MKFVGNALKLVWLAVLFAAAGCEQAYIVPLSKANKVVSVYTSFSPKKIEFMPLTEVVNTEKMQRPPAIRAYISLLDEFGCKIKSPGVFRFELYQRLERSGDRKGRRVQIWPDIDLVEPQENAARWQDFLRAYLFDLGFMPQSNQQYILQATFLSPSGGRISAEFTF